VLLLFAFDLRLQLLDAGIGALERLVHHERRLHQRIDCMRRPSQTIHDQALGIRVAGRIFQFGQTIEQFFHQFLLLRCHAALPGVHIRRLCGSRGGVAAGAVVIVRTPAQHLPKGHLGNL
jgi:hypothetical protein